ncbi:MAG: LLM class F420-dependent oxidoreductase [Acidimicrobiia bacterium]|nr:LLM class F420-dependent oxidoreductase [Acidimicrobiia bacterium]
MKVSFKTRPQHAEWGPMVDFWKEADQIELYSTGWTFDHFYPIFSDPTGPCLEGWTMLAYMAGVTKRIRLGVLVTGNTHRHPAVLANMAATVDVASGGRLELGLGAGWSEEEHTAYGIDLPPWPVRFDRLEESCAVISGLLTQDRFDFDGAHYKLRDAMCNPKPIQRPRPPLLIGGKGRKRTLRIAAQWADEWNFPGGEPAELAELIGVLRLHCADVGRDPHDITVSVKAETDIGPRPFAELVAAYRQAGADHVIAHFAAPHDPANLGRFAEHLAPVVA